MTTRVDAARAGGAAATGRSRQRKPVRTSRTRRAPPPATFAAQLATLVKAPPSGSGWLHEIKYDGYRIGCRIDRGEVTLISRNGNDWSSNFPEIRDAAARLPIDNALLDGEVAVQLPDGHTSFQSLQNASTGSSRSGLTYFIFDLLHLDGVDLSGEPLDARKARLAELLRRSEVDTTRLRYSEHLEGEGATVLAEACRLGLEGIVSKRRDEPYRPGRNDGWLKSKCVNRQEFVIGGFTDPQGRRSGIGALLVGYYDDQGRFVFAGKVGTGFTDRVARDLRARLDPTEQSTSPFAAGPRGWIGKHAHWVQPQLVAEVVFTEWTGDGKVRHPSFQGLRADKTPRDVRREGPRSERPDTVPNAIEPRPAARARASTSGAVRASRRGPASRAHDEEVAGVRISHPARVLFPDANVTKLDLARFYERIAEWILPHLRGRPLTLVRCPTGTSAECFYMKHSKVWAPEPLRRVNIQEKTKIGEYLIADDLPGLIGLVQMDVLELHTWNSTVDDVERPDRLVLDIDPGPEVPFTDAIATARLVRTILNSVDLEGFVKTTGGHGLHVVVPLQRALDWSECLEFSRAVADAIVRTDPARYTTNFAKAGRRRKLLIDYLRNNRTNTSVAAFSTRAKPSAPLSVTLRWDELTPRLRSDQFTVCTVERRLGALKQDPWKEYWTLRQRITTSATKAVTGMAR